MLSPLGTACGVTIAKRIQSFYEKEQFGVKDIEELIEEGFLPQTVVNLGIDFLEFIESIYDNDGNFTDTGMSEEGTRILQKYTPTYGDD